MVLEALKEKSNQNIRHLTKDILKKYVKDIYVFENGEIKIQYK